MRRFPFPPPAEFPFVELRALRRRMPLSGSLTGISLFDATGVRDEVRGGGPVPEEFLCSRLSSIARGVDHFSNVKQTSVDSTIKDSTRPELFLNFETFD